jgi:hypothetical protein
MPDVALADVPADVDRPRLGISLYLSQPEAANLERLAQCPSRGVTQAFTSLQIPEDTNADQQPVLVRRLAEAATAAGVTLYADISPATLDRLVPGRTVVQQVAALSEWGIGVRFDDGFDMATAAAASHVIAVQLNASTVTPVETALLLDAGVVAERVEVLHNYYPRVDTGLTARAYAAANQRFHQHGFAVGAFVPGDGTRRGPLFEGLPTLEDHRDADPLVAAVDLWRGRGLAAGADTVYVGDIDLADDTWRRWRHLAEGVVPLRWRVTASEPGSLRVADLLSGRRLTNRPDETDRVVRAREARPLVAEAFGGVDLQLAQAAGAGAPRPRGSVTVDNEQYGRYLGEVQLVRQDRPADPRVTVLGHVVDVDVPALDLLAGGAAFTLLAQ